MQSEAIHKKKKKKKKSRERWKFPGRPSNGMVLLAKKKSLRSSE